MSNVGNSNNKSNILVYKHNDANNLKKNITQDIKNNNELNFFNKSEISFNSSSGKAISSFSFSEQNNNFIDYTIKKGDSLSEIAKNYLGNSSKYMEIFEANKDKMRNPNDLNIGTVIKIPVNNNSVTIKPENNKVELKNVETFKEITVSKNQSLSILALKHLGNAERYMEIFEANKDILKTPESIKPGMKLKIPVYITNQDKNTINQNKNINTKINNNTSDTIFTNIGSNAEMIYKSLKKYKEYHENIDNNNKVKLTEQEMREIAVELDKASKAFEVDSKLMLAVYAHESGGFNPKARSHTGAGGLGQLTGVAIRQVHYMAGMAKGQKGYEPYTTHKENFITSTKNISERYNIKKNIWTSTAYMSYEIKERNNGNIKKSLERYGDPNVSTYENKVNKEYKILFGKNLF